MDYKKDYYSILGVDEKATSEELRASYRRLAKLYHPDKNPDNPDVEERFKSINEAYEILSNKVNRCIYDSYRTNNKKENESNLSTGYRSSGYHRPPFSTTREKKYTVIRERRIYIRGTIEVKFHGDPELSDMYKRQWEQRFTIIPTEVLVTITSSDIYKDECPKEFQQGYSTAALFATPLNQPVNCKVITAEQGEYYQLDIHDIRVNDPILKDITRYEQYSLGTLEGKLFGYISHQYEEEVTEEYSECYGPTGQVETKTESGYIFTRQQFYTADCSTYWTEWKKQPYHTSQQGMYKSKVKPIFRKDNSYRSNWSWLLALLTVLVIWPRMLYIILSLAISLLIMLLFGWIILVFKRVHPWLCAFLISILLLLAIRSLFHQPSNNVYGSSRHRVDGISTKRAVVWERNKRLDTVITHKLHWADRDSNRFDLQLSVPLSTLRKSTIAHEQMSEQQYVLQGIGAVYRFMLNTDNDCTNAVAKAFDSLARVRSLDRMHEASMIVSCIQSIPYSLIVDKSCSDGYTDDFISQYLAHCQGDCCKGYSKFGVQSPVEFIGDLKGDCDTRALLLYDILGKLHYKVALLTSNYYKHALIAVCLDKALSETDAAVYVNEKPYYLWETTVRGLGPGELPRALSNINYWNITLIQ